MEDGVTRPTGEMTQAGPQPEPRTSAPKTTEGTWLVRRNREDQAMEDPATEDGLVAEMKDMMKQMMGMMEKMDKRVTEVEKDARSSAEFMKIKDDESVRAEEDGPP